VSVSFMVVACGELKLISSITILEHFNKIPSTVASTNKNIFQIHI